MDGSRDDDLFFNRPTQYLANFKCPKYPLPVNRFQKEKKSVLTMTSSIFSEKLIFDCRKELTHLLGCVRSFQNAQAPRFLSLVSKIKTRSSLPKLSSFIPKSSRYDYRVIGRFCLLDMEKPRSTKTHLVESSSIYCQK